MAAEKSTISCGGGTASCKAQVLLAGTVSCSVCLEVVVDGAERSIAKLKCGHHFHLDCIGSAFNAKGRMQCPNCRQVEQGQWLYANGCFLHEDFVDEFTFEDDPEVYNGATNVQFGHTPWCPHQGAYAHIPLTMEDLNNFTNGYMEPLLNPRPGSRSPATIHLCPYLAVQGLSTGGLTHQVDDFLALHAGNRSARNTRRAAGISINRNPAHQQVSSSMSMPHEASQNYNANGRFLHPGGSRYFVGSHQSVHTGPSQGQNFTGHSGQLMGQVPQFQNAQGLYSHSHVQSTHGIRNGYVSSRQARPSEMLPTPSQRITHASPSSEQAWINEPLNDYGSWVAPNAIGQSTSQVAGASGLGWTAAGNQIDPWSGGFYAPQAPYLSSSHWLAWVPTRGNQSQRTVPNTAHSAFPAAVFPRPSVSSDGLPEQTSEGSYSWVHGVR